MVERLSDSTAHRSSQVQVGLQEVEQSRAMGAVVVQRHDVTFTWQPLDLAHPTGCDDRVAGEVPVLDRLTGSAIGLDPFETTAAIGWSVLSALVCAVGAAIDTARGPQPVVA